MWAIKYVEWISHSDFGKLGIFPRTLKGSIGIITSPLIHADVFHLLSNSIPFISFTLLLFYFYRKIAWEAFIWIYLTTGFWVWAFAREAYHIGASGVIYGLAAFLLIGGFISKNIQLLAISFIVILLYGGMFFGISPGTVSANVSWESHLLGVISGILIAFYFRKKFRITAEDDRDDTEQSESDSISSTFENKTYFTYTYKEKLRKEN